MPQRLALIIAVSTYEDPKFQPLPAATADAKALSEVLSNPEIGSFVVTHAVDITAERLRVVLEDFFEDAQHEDTLFVHLSCHGVKKIGELYFAGSNTEFDRIKSTGVSAQFVNQLMGESKSTRIIASLDCCFSGAFVKGFSSRGTDQSVSLESFENGRGTYVISASTSIQYAYEGDELAAESPRPAVFTGAMVEGLQSGDADTNRDGFITPQELYDYVYAEVRKITVEQTPMIANHNVRGTVVIARSPVTATADAPDPEFERVIPVLPTAKPLATPSKISPSLGRLTLSFSGNGKWATSFALGALQTMQRLELYDQATRVNAVSSGGVPSFADAVAKQSIPNLRTLKEQSWQEDQLLSAAEELASKRLRFPALLPATLALIKNTIPLVLALAAFGSIVGFASRWLGILEVTPNGLQLASWVVGVAGAGLILFAGIDLLRRGWQSTRYATESIDEFLLILRRLTMRLTVFFTFSLIVLPGSTVLLERLTQSGRIGAPTARAFIDLRLVRETVCGDRGMIAHSTCSYQFGKLPLTNIPLAVATCVVLFYALVLLAINLPDGRSRAIVVIAKVVGLAICILTALLASTVVVSALLFVATQPLSWKVIVGFIITCCLVPLIREAGDSDLFSAMAFYRQRLARGLQTYTLNDKAGNWSGTNLRKVVGPPFYSLTSQPEVAILATRIHGWYGASGERRVGRDTVVVLAAGVTESGDRFSCSAEAYRADTPYMDARYVLGLLTYSSTLRGPAWRPLQIVRSLADAQGTCFIVQPGKEIPTERAVTGIFFPFARLARLLKPLAAAVHPMGPQHMMEVTSGSLHDPLGLIGGLLSSPDELLCFHTENRTTLFQTVRESIEKAEENTGALIDLDLKQLEQLASNSQTHVVLSGTCRYADGRECLLLLAVMSPPKRIFARGSARRANSRTLRFGVANGRTAADEVLAVRELYVAMSEGISGRATAKS